jgi:hypothetical protein
LLLFAFLGVAPACGSTRDAASGTTAQGGNVAVDGGARSGEEGGAPAEGGRSVNGSAGNVEGGATNEADCVGSSECRACTCESCSSRVVACEADDGCLRINDCADERLCDEVDCYDDGVCKEVIDEQGGLLGTSMRRATGLWTCKLEAACPCHHGEF